MTRLAARSPTPLPRSHLAASLAVCVAAIVYVTLYPWSGWRMPAASIFAFLAEPWPRYWTRLDLLLNFLAYLPLGLLGAAWLARRLPHRLAALAMAAAAAALSCGLEALQALLPARVSSLTDLIANTAGAAAGAAAAAAIGPRRIGGGLEAAIRLSRIAPGAAPGLLLLAVWLAVQWHPQPIAFASGELAPLLGALAPSGGSWLASIQLDVEQGPLVEAIAAAATTVGVGLLTRELLRSSSGWAIAAPIVLAGAVKSSATASLLGGHNALAWLSAGAQGGLLAGALLLALFVGWSPRHRLIAAIAALGFATVLYNLAPPNVYFMSTMAAWNQGEWANVNGLLRAFAIVWPFAAIGWCAARLRRIGTSPIIATP